MPSGEFERGRQPGPRKYAYNMEAAREREMHLYGIDLLSVYRIGQSQPRISCSDAEI